MAYALDGFGDAAPLREVPYRGDDWAQALAKRLWLPMLAMGVMAVAFGLGAGIYSGVKLGDFFANGNPIKLGTATATLDWDVGVAFLGMALILSSITMVLVNVVRTLRDTGRDVQGAVGATSITQLRKPLAGQLIPHVMMMGLAVVMGGLVIGIVQATKLGNLPPAGLASPATLLGSRLADDGTAQALGAWVTPLRLLGLAIIFTSIVLALRTIIQAIRFQAQRVEELAGVRATGLVVHPAPKLHGGPGHPRAEQRSSENGWQAPPVSHTPGPDGAGFGPPRASVYTRSLGRYF